MPISHRPPGKLTATVRTVYGDDGGVNWDEPVPAHAIPMSAEDARLLIPRYNGIAQHDMLQWHLGVCAVCKASGPCREYFEIIAEYAEYEGYAMKGEG